MKRGWSRFTITVEFGVIDNGQSDWTMLCSFSYMYQHSVSKHKWPIEAGTITDVTRKIRLLTTVGSGRKEVVGQAQKRLWATPVRSRKLLAWRSGGSTAVYDHLIKMSIYTLRA